ncbi:MAG: hypothetical protein HUU15_03370 [Candidatus Brocadiae bacterium]|nr:hypothetical protein [Candidatus Brocadiia bacterium]
MKWGLTPWALFVSAGLVLAEPGGGTQVQPDKPANKTPAGNPNAAEPGLEAQGWKAHDATYVPVLKDWSIKTYMGTTAAVANRNGQQVLPLPVNGKDGVAVKAEEFAIEVDGNHDGKFEERLKTDGSSCLVTLTYEDGTTAPYAVRFLKGRGASWAWQRSGYWTATINKVQVGILDDNSNGRYDENGKDAISVGLTGYAAPLSEIASIGGTLYQVKVSADGKKIYTREYSGETGKLDARSGHKSLGLLASAVFQNGQTFVDFAIGKDKAVVVPVGNWEFVGGETRAVGGGQAAMMKKGSMLPIEVKAGETAQVAWGMDLTIGFDFDLNGSSVSITVDSVHVYGKGGEEYYNFVPPAFTPVVTVINTKTNQQAQKGKMALC